jgi:CobQ-like glutamine amidotransferase family enzyme
VNSCVDIGILLPDVLSTYSDAGNADILLHRMRWREIPARVVLCTAATAPTTTCDIYLVGGGEDTAQIYAMQWLRSHPALCRALESDAITLAVCAGFQILGTSIVDLTGTCHPGAGILDVCTTPGKKRAVGEVISDCVIPDVGVLSGFENHRGVTTLGPGLAPLGHVRHGTGNGVTPSAVHGDGATTDRVIATYLHGPVLARNPALADYLISRIVGHSLPELDVPDQDAVRAYYLRRQGERAASVAGFRWGLPCLRRGR